MCVRACVRVCAFTRTASPMLRGAREEWQVAARNTSPQSPFFGRGSRPWQSANNRSWEEDSSDAAAGGGGCAAAHKTLAAGREVYFIWGISIPASLEDSSVRAHPSLQLLTPPHPAPPQDLRFGADGRGGGRKGTGTGESWVGWADILGGGRVLGSARGKPGGGVSVLWPPLPAAARAALDGRTWVGERAERAGEHPTRPLPGRHESRAPPPPPANSGPSHGDQSERGWLGGKPREAFISARVAAGSCQDSLPVLQRNGLSRSTPGGTPPCGGVPSLPSFRGDKMESRWLPGGLLVCPARASPLVPPSRRLGASLPPLWHTHARGTVQTGACCL